MELGGPNRTFSPWKRRRPEYKGCHLIIRHSFFEEFDRDIYGNMDLDIGTKRAALKVSASVVSLVSLTGGKPFFMGSGTIIESEEVDGTHLSTILTSASLLRSTPESDALPGHIKIDVYLSDGKFLEGQVFSYDFHYNIAAIKIKTELALPTATLRILDDSISVIPSAISESFQLRPHSDVFKLYPGDMVVAVGRYFEKPNELMAAPGKFSLDCVNFDCKELFRANCQITKCGIGGPLVNRYGEVIGVNFYDSVCTPFLPINIAVKCLEHFKIYGRFCRPWLGMEMTNLHVENVGKMDKITQKFPNISKGALVEEVIEGSPAECSGICSGDVIIQCGDKDVQSFLEFYGMVLEKTGEFMELVVLREASGQCQRLQITVKASETSPDKFYRWPLPEKREVCVGSVR